MKPKLKSCLRSSLALTLCASMLTSVMFGCKSDNGGNDNNTAEAQAAYVTWSKTGEFTTTLSAKGVDLSDVEAADVSVVTFKPVDVSEDQSSSSENSDEQANEPETISYPVESVEKKGDDLEITFKDDNAAEKSVDSYTVEIEKKNISTTAIVDYPAPTVKAEETGVLATEKDPELTLTLDSGFFSEEVKPEQISLAGSFSDMEVEKATPKSNKLELKLKGEIETPEGQGVYVDGIIGVNPSAMENERSSASVRVPIQQSLITFNADKMTVSGSTVTVPLTVIGEEDLDNIKSENIRFFSDDSADEDEQPQERPAVTVTGVEKAGENSLNVTMNVEGATDKNSAAEALDNRTVQLGDTTFLANFQPASIYPKLDYVEQDGDNLKLGLVVTAQNGAFDSKLTAEQISFDGDLEDAKVVSIERENATSANLTFTIPANGQTKEKFTYEGAVIFKAGALVNPWGDKTSAPTEYVRQYSQDTVGRGFETYMALTSVFGKANIAVMAATAGLTIAMIVLQTTGAVKTANEQLLDINEQINKNLDATFETIDKNRNLIDEIQDVMILKSVSDFNLKLAMLNTYCLKFQHYFKPGMIKLLGFDKVEPVNNSDSAAVKAKKLKKIKEISQAVFEAENSRDDETAHIFRDFFNTYTTMRNYYNSVCAVLKTSGDSNPINAYSKLLARTTNFDTIAYTLRNQYIDSIRATMLVGYSNIFLFNLRSTTIKSDATVKMRAVASTAEEDFNAISLECEKVINNNNKMSIKETEKKDGVTYYEKAYCYPFGIYVDSLDSANRDVFWAKTWRGEEKDGASMQYNRSKYVADVQGTSYAKGAGVFVYSHNNNAYKIIIDTHYAPDYIAKNYYWGEGMFSAKAPSGFANDAIYAEKSEDIIAANADQFVKRMNGRTLREELQLAGIQVDDDIYETTEGLPFASMVSYGSKTLNNGGSYFIEAKTYMNIIKWDDKYITKLVPAASRTVRRFVRNEFGYSAQEDDLDSVWEHDWLREGKTGIGDYYTAESFFNEQKKRFDGVGDKNLIPIVRWVIDTPGDDGTSPNRDYSMNSD